MTARYLRVKKWKDWQHYKDREPPWVKLHSKLLQDDLFMELPEHEQWQLVRIWIVASQSSRFTLDEKKRVVPVVVEDERSLRRSTKSLKKVPLAKFISEGWLIPVAEDDLYDPPTLSTVKSDASPVIAPGNPGDSALLEAEGRGLERTSSNGSSHQVRRALPVEHEFLLRKLMKLVAASADEGTEGVLSGYAARLPESSLAKIVESTARQPAANRSAYANGALQSEIRERDAA